MAWLNLIGFVLAFIGAVLVADGQATNHEQRASVGELPLALGLTIYLGTLLELSVR
jgi:uncharacterized membrane protein